MATITLKLTVDIGKGDPVNLTVIRLKPAYTHLQAASSRADQPAYDVVASALGARCNCRGFLFRGTCRHADAALVALDMAVVS